MKHEIRTEVEVIPRPTHCSCKVERGVSGITFSNEIPTRFSVIPSSSLGVSNTRSFSNEITARATATRRAMVMRLTMLRLRALLSHWKSSLYWKNLMMRELHWSVWFFHWRSLFWWNHHLLYSRSNALHYLKRKMSSYKKSGVAPTLEVGGLQKAPLLPERRPFRQLPQERLLPFEAHGLAARVEASRDAQKQSHAENTREHAASTGPPIEAGGVPRAAAARLHVLEAFRHLECEQVKFSIAVYEIFWHQKRVKEIRSKQVGDTIGPTPCGRWFGTSGVCPLTTWHEMQLTSNELSNFRIQAKTPAHLPCNLHCSEGFQHCLPTLLCSEGFQKDATLKIVTCWLLRRSSPPFAEIESLAERPNIHLRQSANEFLKILFWSRCSNAAYLQVDPSTRFDMFLSLNLHNPETILRALPPAKIAPPSHKSCHLSQSTLASVQTSMKQSSQLDS